MTEIFNIKAINPSSMNNPSRSKIPSAKRTQTVAGGKFVPGGRGSASRNPLKAIAKPAVNRNGIVSLIPNHLGFNIFSSFCRRLAPALKMRANKCPGRLRRIIHAGAQSLKLKLIPKPEIKTKTPKGTDKPGIGTGKMKGTVKSKTTNA